MTSEPPDDPTDVRLRSHLADALAPHRGRAAGRFRSAATAARPRPPTWPWWVAASAAGLAAAASVVVVVVARRPPAGPTHAAPIAHVDRPSTDAVPIELVQQDSRWQTVDRGVIRLGDGSPARLMVQRRLDSVRFFDADRHATIEYTVPRERTVYVGLTAY